MFNLIIYIHESLSEESALALTKLTHISQWRQHAVSAQITSISKFKHHSVKCKYYVLSCEALQKAKCVLANCLTNVFFSVIYYILNVNKRYLFWRQVVSTHVAFPFFFGLWKPAVSHITSDKHLVGCDQLPRWQNKMFYTRITAGSDKAGFTSDRSAVCWKCIQFIFKVAILVLDSGIFEFIWPEKHRY